MTHALFSLILILAIVLCPNSAHAQQNTADVALREKAFKLLELAAGQIGSLQSPENRARLGANIADSLWDHDEKRARAVFALVEEDIRAGLANRDLDDPRDRHTLKVFLKLRVDTVERIAKYDAELALGFLKATEYISEKPLPRDMTESERGFELRLARQMANNNPEIAAKLARQSLADGLSIDLLLLLKQLNKKDKEQALTLYKEITKKLREVNLPEDWNSRYFVQTLIHSFRPPTSDNSAFRDLIGTVVTRALEHGCGNKSMSDGHESEFCRWTASLLPQLDRIDPRAGQLRRWVSEDLVNLSPEGIHEFYELAEEGTVNDLLAFAAKHPDIADEVYVHVIRKAVVSNDFDLARRLATDRFTDPERRGLILTQINSAQAATSVDDKKLAELQSQLNEVNTIVDKFRFLLARADDFGVNNRNAALKLLKQASEIADSMKPGKEQTDAQLRVALSYCLEKNDRGFTIMESLMPKLNELVDAAVKLDGYETGYVRDGEWNMSANGSVGDMLTTLSLHAGNFAWCDFDRAVSLAAQFDRPEIRLMAHVKLAQAILAGPPKRERNRSYDSMF